VTPPSLTVLHRMCTSVNIRSIAARFVTLVVDPPRCWLDLAASCCFKAPEERRPVMAWLSGSNTKNQVAAALGEEI
jgi:hypothetical protein